MQALGQPIKNALSWLVSRSTRMRGSNLDGRTRLVLTALLVSTFVLLQSGCSNTRVDARSAEKYNQQPLMVVIPEGVDNKAAIYAAESALIGRGWAVESKSDTEISGKLNHRRFDATGNIKIEGENLVIYSDSVYLDPQTNELSPAVPYGWLGNLQKDIRTFIMYERNRGETGSRHRGNSAIT